MWTMNVYTMVRIAEEMAISGRLLTPETYKNISYVCVKCCGVCMMGTVHQRERKSASLLRTFAHPTTTADVGWAKHRVPIANSC